MKKIVVNTRLLLKDRLEGIGWFSNEVLKRITQQHPEVEFHFLFDRPFDASFIFSNNVIPHVIGFPTRHPLLWYSWFEWAVPRAIAKINPDLFFSPDGFLSLSSPVKSIPVIHDINFFHEPGHLAWSHAKYYNHFFPKYAHKAHHICTVSEYSKADLSKQYTLASNKIDVVYNGIHEHLHPVSEKEKQNTLNTLTAGVPYFFFIGSIHPRKNMVRMLQAFDEFKSKTGSHYKLIIAGQRMWWTADMENTWRQLKHQNDVQFLGRISEDDYQRYLSAAFCLLYPSLYEGFGIPLIEAMHCEIPVIASNSSCMPEIVRDSALLCDPLSYENLAQNMIQLYQNEALRTALIEKGKSRALDFSWHKTAEKVWACLPK